MSGISAPEAAAQVLRRRLARKTYRAWCEMVLGQDNKKPARHHLFLIDKLQKICDGQDGRTMVLMPPGYAKSTFSSVLFPPYFMAHHPGAQLIMGSAGLGLAVDFSGKVQRLIKEHSQVLGYSLNNDNKELWYTSTGGRYKATGVGSDIAGVRSDLTLIDDPFGSFEDAQSPAARKKVYDWYRSDIIGRQLPGSRIVIIMTRRHEDDLVGRLLEDDPDEWEVCRLPEIAEEDDLLGRAPGELLWPEFYTEKTVEKRRRATGARDYATQYQQRPMAEGGALFEIERIAKVSGAGLPPGRRVRAWDIAATAQIGSRDPDYTAGVRLGMNVDTVVIEDVVRDRGGPQMVEKLIVDTARLDGPGVTIRLPQDPGAAGKMLVSYLTSRLAGYHVVSAPVSGGKATRAQPIASQVNVGNVAMVAAPWNRSLIDELETFPDGKHDDQVDALADAYAALIGAKTHKPARAVHLPFMGR